MNVTTTTRPADTINGFPVIRSHPTPAAPATRAGRVVLVDRGENYPRYVTAWQGDGDKDWWKGHYITGLVEAMADFNTRVDRGW